MEQEILYAKQWDESAKYFYETKRYSWMAEKLTEYKTILEIGCGTGYSTLALVEAGHTVISVDKNSFCINKAKELIESKGIESQVHFIEGDIAESAFRNYLKESCSYDMVICWNVGTYWTREMMQFYLPHMIEYGLTVPQIKENPESSYSELIIWETCRLAAESNVPVQIVDRGTEPMYFETDPYYKTLGVEFGYSKVYYDNLEADSISNTGRMLSTNGAANDSEKVRIVLISVIFE